LTMDKRQLGIYWKRDRETRQERNDANTETYKQRYDVYGIRRMNRYSKVPSQGYTVNANRPQLKKIDLLVVIICELCRFDTNLGDRNLSVSIGIFSVEITFYCRNILFYH